MLSVADLYYCVTSAARQPVRPSRGLPYLPSVSVQGRRVTGLAAPRYLPSWMTGQHLAQRIKDDVAERVSPWTAAFRIGPWIAVPVLLAIAVFDAPDLLQSLGMPRSPGVMALLCAGFMASMWPMLKVLSSAASYTGHAAAAHDSVRRHTREVIDERALHLFDDYTSDTPPAERGRIFDELVDMAADPDRAWLISGAVDHMRETIEHKRETAEARRQQAARDAADAAARILAPQLRTVQDVLEQPIGVQTRPAKPPARPR